MTHYSKLFFKLVMLVVLQSLLSVQALGELLPSLANDGHRVLIFSQWTTMLDILEWALEVIGVTYRRLDGGYVLFLDFFHRILLCLLAILSFFQDRCNRKADHSGHIQQ